MRILIGTATFHPEENGVSTFLQHLAPALQKRGHKVMIIGPSMHRKDERREFKGVPIFGLRSMKFPLNKHFRMCLSPALRRLLEREVKKFSPDVIHVQDPFTINLTLTHIAKKMRVPLVATHHTDITLYEEYYKKFVPPPIRSRVLDFEWMLLCWYFSLMDTVTAPTKSAAEPLAEYGLTKEVRIISNGIDVACFRKGHIRSNVRKQYALPEKPLLLSVGRLDPEKNVDGIIKAFHAARKSIDLHLVIVGKGKEQKRLKKLVKKLHAEDDITFTGFVQNNKLPAIYGIADCFIVAGESETQGIVTMEAMAAGLPVIAANALALPELVKHGKNGFLFPPGNVGRMTSCIKQMFRDKALRNRMGKKSLRMIDRHDIPHTINAFIDTYASLIPKK